MTEIIISLISLGGSMVISLAGVFINQKLVIYRLEQLERQVEKHNTLVERMYAVEKRVDLEEEKIRVANHRIEDLEKNVQ